MRRLLRQRRLELREDDSDYTRFENRNPHFRVHRSTRDVAKILGISHQAVEQQEAKALKKLRVALADLICIPTRARAGN